MVTVLGLLERARGRALKSILQQGVGAFLLSVATGVISGVISVSELVTAPIDAFAEVLVTVIEAFFLIPLEVLRQGGVTSAQSIEPGGAFDVGPLTLFVGLGIVLGFYWILARYLSEDETSNVAPGLPFDLGFWPFRDEEASGDD